MISSLSNTFSSLVGLPLMQSISNPDTESLTSQETRLRQNVKDNMDIIMYDKDANLVNSVVTYFILNSFNATQFLELLKINQTN